MAITAEQWKKIEEQLIGSYGTVKLSLEGKKLTLTKKYVGENQLAIAVYVDDYIKPAWAWKSSDEFDPFVTKIWRPRSKFIYTPKQQKEVIKDFGKRGAKKHFPELEKKQYWWDCYFPKFSPLKRQYSKLEGLEVVAIGIEVLAKDLAESAEA